jgi:putative ABC transport system substrate-binding protein
LTYVEGQNLSVIYRYAEGKYERLADLARELIDEWPDLVLALGGYIAPYAAKATSTSSGNDLASISFTENMAAYFSR